MVIYGRGAASVGEQIGKTKEEAQAIIDKFFKAFPLVKQWIDKTISNAHIVGYVEDVAGRRRHLPDILLPKYDIKDKKSENDFNPLLNCSRAFLSDSKVDKYKKMLEKVRSRRDYEDIQRQALSEDIEIHDNTGFIAQAERQAVNSRVQGGAATLTKTALIDIYHDPDMRKLGAKLINTVHDEILVEAPKVNAQAVADRLTSLMVQSAKKYVEDVPMSCDPYIVHCWYFDEFCVTVQKEFDDYKKNQNVDDLQAFEYIVKNRTESTRAQLYEILRDSMKDKPADYEELNREIEEYSK